MSILSIIIPLYNEESLVEQLLDRVLNAPLSIQKEIIVIDDGSTDHSFQKVAHWQEEHPEVPLKVLRKSNGGKGSAVRLGIAHSTGSIVIIQDADLEYDPGDYQACIAPIQQREVLVVYGSRELGGHNTEKSHFSFYLGGLLITLMTNLLFNAQLTDEPTCYKTFSGNLIRALHFDGNGFEWEPELTAKLLRLGFRIQEVPIRYYPRSIHEGKKIKWRYGIKAMTQLVRVRFCRLRPLQDALSLRYFL